MDKLLYGKACPDEGDTKALNTFLRTTNLTYMCRMIHNMLFNIVMRRVGFRDRFYIYKIMVGEKVNLPEIIFLDWMQVFKDRFNPKVKKNHIPFGIFFTRILRLAGVEVSFMEPSVSATQLKGATFVKIAIAEKFPKYMQRHIKKKVKKEVIKTSLSYDD